MTKKGIITGIVVGAAALVAWHLYRDQKAKASEPPPKPADPSTATKSFVGQDVAGPAYFEQGFTEATMKDFNIVVPPWLPSSKKVRDRSERLTTGRYAYVDKHLKTPVYI